MQSINEILGRLKTQLTRNTQQGNTETISLKGRPITKISYPGGRAYYWELGIWTSPGEDLTMALARLRSEKIAKLFGEAQIPARFQQWEFRTFPADKNKKKAFDVAKNYAKKRTNESLFIIGGWGVGKTGLAIPILKERIAQGVPSLFISAPDLLDKIRSTFGGHGDYTATMEAVKTVDFLVLDDIGAEYPTAWVQEKMYQLIGYRHAWELPIVGTSNFELEELEERLGGRSLWRMIEMGKIVLLKGKDLRKRR